MNKKHKFPFLLLALLMMLLSFASCSKLQDLLNDDNDDDDNKGENPSEIVEGVMMDYQLSGFVKDVDGTPLGGVTVTTGSTSISTNTLGFFDLSQVNMVDSRSVVRFSKDGYFDIVRSMDRTDGGDSWQVVMCKKGNNDFTSVKTYDASTAQTLQAGGMKIEMPEDGYRVDGTGTAYTGKVKTDMLYLDPNNDVFAEMMPGGDLAAVRSDGSNAQLVSYGMVDIHMQGEDGEKLQLKEGSKAKLTFPIPVGMNNDLPSAIPLWSFNEQTGLWEEEGVATLQGNVYVGEVSHFSWANLDYPQKQGTLVVNVKDEEGNPLPNVHVSIGQILSRETGYDGTIVQTVPANEDFEVTVKPDYYGNYGGISPVKVPALQPYETREINIVLPRLVRVYGSVVDSNQEGVKATIRVSSDTWRLDDVQTDANGYFSVYIPQDKSGDATVLAQTYGGQQVSKKITIAKEDVEVLLQLSGSSSGGASVNMIHIYSDKLGDANWPVPAGDLLSGVVLLDNDLILTPDEDAKILLSIQVPDYEKNKEKYSNGVVTYAANTKTNAYFSSEGKSVECTVLRSGNKFTFAVEGNGTYVNSETENFDDNAKIKGENLVYNLFFAGKLLRNIIPSEVGYPSFTPQLATKAPMALLISESTYLGKGGIIYYNGGSSDFLTLKNAAAKQGFAKVSEENEDGFLEVTYYSEAKKSVITIEYDPSCPGATDQTSWEEIESKAPIYMAVLEGIDRKMLESMFADNARTRAGVKGNPLRHYLAKIAKTHK